MQALKIFLLKGKINFPQKLWDDGFYLLDQLKKNSTPIEQLQEEFFQWGKDYRYSLGPIHTRQQLKNGFHSQQ